MERFRRRPPRWLRVSRYAARRVWCGTVGLWVPRIPGNDPWGTHPAQPVIPQAVVVDDCGRVLLVKRTNPRAWEIPGGYMIAGEQHEETIVREVREETGLDVTIERLIGWYERTGFRPHLSPVYLCRPSAGILRHSREAVATAFFAPSHLPVSLFPWYRAVIADALSHRSSVVSPGREQPAPWRTQHLGLVDVLASLSIHVGTRLGLLP